MNVSEIMVNKLFTLSSEDTISKAVNIMYQHNINQIPIVDDNHTYLGMVFSKEFLKINILPQSKVKSFIVKTPILNPIDSIEKCTQLIVETGNSSLPIIENGKLIGIVGETDVLLTAEFGHSTIDEVMSGAIVIEENAILSNALSKMRRYNISRLPVINSSGILTGVINPLDIARIIAAPRERDAKSAGIDTITDLRGVKAKDISRRAFSVETNTHLNAVIENFRRHSEIIVVGNGRPIGIITPKDTLELTLPKQTRPSIHIAHLDDNEARQEIEEQMYKFMNKIQGKIENIHHIVVYVDKHKSHKYSVRARVMTGKGVIDAKATEYDVISASRQLISRLERRMKAGHVQKVRRKQHRETARKEINYNADEEI